MGGKTIAAVSTPPGSGGIAVIRISGPASLDILAKLWKGKNPAEFGSHTAHTGWIKDENGSDLDQVVATYFKAPNSYTGEDVIEISCHGSPWIQQAILTRIIENGGATAEAGEFTRRAFENGRLDLAQAEGVADMIAASSKAAARLAATQMRGDFSDKLKALRNRLIDLGALLELELDFSEEDVEFADRFQLISLSEEIYAVVKRLADSYKTGKAFKGGIPVAIVGVPNAGKSTLLNCLVGEEKAIVSEIAGTTRDVIEDTVEIRGLLFRFFDTAGLRESSDEIESIGIDRARRKLAEANIVLCLVDSTRPLEEQEEIREVISKSKENAEVICVITKKDLPSGFGNSDFEAFAGSGNMIEISAHTGEGLETLQDRLAEKAMGEYNPEKELIVTNTRHYEALRNALPPLERLIEGLRSGVSGDFLAQDLREAEFYLGTVTGEVSSSDILHTIFSRFCIGK